MGPLLCRPDSEWQTNVGAEIRIKEKSGVVAVVSVDVGVYSEEGLQLQLWPL